MPKPPKSTPAKPPAAVVAGPEDPLSPAALRQLAWRVGPIVLGVWVVAALINHRVVWIVVAALTVIAAGLLVWALRWAARARAVASLVQGADTPEARKAALAKLETEYGKGDANAAVARAQLLMQEPDDGPRRALATLETIDLGKVLPAVADEVRAQRAMIHLVLGETEPARALADNVDLSRHANAKTRAMLATVVAEAWARTGQAKKAIEIMSVFRVDDPEYADLAPQMHRSLAFAHASVNDLRAVRADLHKLFKLNPQLLAGFLQKKVHPLLRKEAEQLLAKSGLVPRQTVVRRM